jgi:hypothetical protein
MSTIESSIVSAAIAEYQAAVAKAQAKLNAALGIEAAAVVTKKKRATTPKDPSAEPKPPSPWIAFNQRVSATLKEAKVLVERTPDYMQFASSLKEQNGDYDSWTTETILAAWPKWTRPTVSKMEQEGKSKRKNSKGGESSAEEGSVQGDKPDKKAAAAAKRAASKAAKAVKVAEETVVAVETKAAEVVAETKPVETKPAPKKGKAVGKKTFTIEELIDFSEHIIGEVVYGKNERGDVVDKDGAYAGQWKNDKLVKGAPPADWAAVEAAMA